MSTWTNDEYKKLLGYKAPKNFTSKATPMVLSTEGIPDGHDWRGLAVNPVQDQGRCGSCWAFSANTALESAQKIKNGGELVNLSE
jgi:C1A family cysteine protease